MSLSVARRDELLARAETLPGALRCPPIRSPSELVVTSLAELLPGSADARLSRVQPLLLRHFAEVFQIELEQQLESVPPDPGDLAQPLFVKG